MNFPVLIFHVWDAAEPFSVFPVQRGEDHSDKFRGGSVSLKNQAYTPALRQRHPSAPAFSVLHHKGRYAGTEYKVPRHRSGIPPWKNPFSFLPLLPVRPNQTLPASRILAVGSWMSTQMFLYVHSQRHPRPSDATSPPTVEPHIQNSRPSCGCPYSSF